MLRSTHLSFYVSQSPKYFKLRFCMFVGYITHYPQIFQLFQIVFKLVNMNLIFLLKGSLNLHCSVDVSTVYVWTDNCTE
jgi:hypothetical protein